MPTNGMENLLKVLLLLSPFLLTHEQKVDPGEPLFLTPLVREGRYAQAQEAALVSDYAPILSYSGYITVNDEYNSSLFFWFFPAEPSYNQTEGNYDEEIPVLLWNDGGPGSSLFFSAFAIGPYHGSKDGADFTVNPHSWHKKYHMIYIDNPVTVGFSHTQSHLGLIDSEEDAAKDMYEFLQQFFSMFPHLQRNPFYNAGVSYGAKYAVQTANLIHHRNLLDDEPTKFINLTGVIVDSPLIDPYTQLFYSDYIFNAGLINEKDRDDLAFVEHEILSLIDDGMIVQATGLFVWMRDRYVELTGYNSLYHVYDDQWGAPDMTPWVTSNSTRKNLHAGNLPFLFNNPDLFGRMAGSILRSSKPQLEELLQLGYRFLLAVGNMDGVTGHLGIQRMLMSLQWEGAEELLSGPRDIWRLEGSSGVAGYQTHSGKATLAIVRNAGHGTPMDKPEELLNLVNTFLEKGTAKK